ncbi:MAG: NAD(P)-binding protein [Solirubrobacterales bacterium]
MSRHQARLIVTLGAIATALGIWGHMIAGAGFDDAAYSTARLFALEFDSPGVTLPTQIEVARFLAPAVTAGAIWRTAAAFLREEIDGVVVRWRYRNHILICGAGDRGSQLARAFRHHTDPDESSRVVVLDSDAGCANIDGLRSLGARVLVGDATNREELLRAGARTASRVICVTGSDNDNAAIVSQLGQLHDGTHLQNIHSHVSSPSLDAQLTAHSISAMNDGQAVEWFNTERRAASSLLSDFFSTYRAATDRGHDTRGFAVVGSGQTALSLLLEAGRQWWALQSGAVVAGGAKPDVLGRLRVKIVDPDAESVVRQARAGLRGIEQILEISTMAADDAIADWIPQNWRVVFVALDDPIAAMTAGLELRQRCPTSAGTEIVVRVLIDADGLAGAFQAGEDPNGPLHVVNIIKETCSVRFVQSSLIEQLARENHYVYQLAVEHEPASKRWTELDSAFRSDNRAAAFHHVESKLKALGAALVPVTNLQDHETLVLEDSEVERLSRMEHDRWVAAKRATGYEYGRSRDAMHHPDIVDWEGLSEQSRERDRMFVRALPQMFNACGYRLVRIGSAPDVRDRGSTDAS